MPELWRHATHLISFTVVVDNFGVKYTNKNHVNHLIECLKIDYKLTKDWDGDLSISLDITKIYSYQLHFVLWKFIKYCFTLGPPQHYYISE